MKIIKYILFKSSDELVKWQIESNQKQVSINIISVMPQMSNFNIDTGIDGQSKADTEIGCFVIYSIIAEENDK